MAEEWVPITTLYTIDPSLATYPLLVNSEDEFPLTEKSEYSGLVTQTTPIRVRIGPLYGTGEFDLYLAPIPDGDAIYLYGNDQTTTTALDQDWTLTAFRTFFPYGGPPDIDDEPVDLEVYIDFFVDLGSLAPPEIWTSFIGSVESNIE